MIGAMGGFFVGMVLGIVGGILAIVGGVLGNADATS